MSEEGVVGGGMNKEEEKKRKEEKRKEKRGRRGHKKDFIYWLAGRFLRSCLLPAPCSLSIELCIGGPYFPVSGENEHTQKKVASVVDHRGSGGRVSRK